MVNFHWKVEIELVVWIIEILKPNYSDIRAGSIASF